MAWSSSENKDMPVPRGVDPDEFRSRKATGGDLFMRDIAHPERSIRDFKARRLIRQIDLAGAPIAPPDSAGGRDR